jgi:abhydrolase domain-containing protein 11
MKFPKLTLLLKYFISLRSLIQVLISLSRHGLFGFRTNWRSLAKAFSDRANIKVVTVDMRNHGDSPSTTSMTYLDMASDLIQTIRKHKTQKTILMGHSMGGKAAMVVALQEVII